jgi:cholesterol oxidase
VRAPVLVLSAGVLGSTRLLLQSRRRLPRLSAALGRRFSGNGDALGVAFDPRAPGVTGARNDIGPTITSILDFTHDRRLGLADGGLPDGFGGLLDVARGVDVVRGWRRLLLRLRDLLAKAGWTDVALRPRELRVRPRRSNADALVFLMFGRDAADGEIRLTRGLRRLDVRFSPQASAQLFRDLERTTHELAAAADATPFHALDGGPLGRPITVHPLGGCAMADDPARGVVDPFGRVHGYPGLHVIDGAMVPTALGVNPSKTIAALAERSAARLVESA